MDILHSCTSQDTASLFSLLTNSLNRTLTCVIINAFYCNRAEGLRRQLARRPQIRKVGATVARTARKLSSQLAAVTCLRGYLT